MKKIIALFLSLILAISICQPAYAAGGSVSELNAEMTLTSISVSGAVSSDVAAVMVEVLNGTNTITFMSFSVANDNKFSGTISGLSLSYNTDYTVRAADYAGGSWNTVTVKLENTYIPGGGPQLGSLEKLKVDNNCITIDKVKGDNKGDAFVIDPNAIKEAANNAIKSGADEVKVEVSGEIAKEGVLVDLKCIKENNLGLEVNSGENGIALDKKSLETLGDKATISIVKPDADTIKALAKEINVDVKFFTSLVDISVEDENGIPVQIFDDGTVIIKFNIPEELAGKKISGYFVDESNRVSKLRTKEKNGICFVESYHCSLFGIAEEAEIDAIIKEQSEVNPFMIKFTAEKSSQKITWKAYEDADYYKVYGTKCGQTYKKLATIKATDKLSFTNKKTDNGSVYKYYVVAYQKDENGKAVKLAKSVKMFGVNTKAKKYTNASKLKVDSATLTINQGNSGDVKATVTKADKAKKLIDTKKIPKLYYETTNDAIATVDENGKVFGVGLGECYVYTYTADGILKKVKVTVK